ncbi:aldo/keto reductase [Arthrobacter rhombi]|uniref:aldo/keto reductase n=1 Tax=Micrococcaceae TaxID=1268 RepID=UPI000BB77E0C|nr:aldo/keto reductase [Glutamicibacter sp. BW78]PCC24287.1 aldo/keto reductase [Glutamicibacter sp. BW78]
MHDAGSRLVFGCMGLGGDWGTGPIEAADVATAHAAVDAALHAGITVFDHADIYRNGKAEAVFGMVLAQRPGLAGNLQLQTKCGIVLGDAQTPGRYDSSAASILSGAEESLVRLGVERIDTLLVHRPDPLTPPEEIAAAFSQLHRAGKVGRFGVSNHSAVQMTRLQSVLDQPLAVNQLHISLGHRGWVESAVMVNVPQGPAGPASGDAGDQQTQTDPSPALAAAGFPAGTLEYCAAHQVQVQAWGSMDRGRYTAPAADAPEADRDTAARVEQVARKLGSTKEAVVLGWVMRHPAGIRPVIGTTNPRRIVDCAPAEDVAARMSGADWYGIWTAARGEPLP